MPTDASPTPHGRPEAHPCKRDTIELSAMRPACFFAPIALACTLVAQESVDLNVIYRIKNEAFKKGKVADHLQMLTDRYGPRLTASPEYDAAAEWITTRF